MPGPTDQHADLRDAIAKDLFVRSMRVSLDDDYDEVFNHAMKAYRLADAFIDARMEHTRNRLSKGKDRG